MKSLNKRIGSFLFLIGISFLLLFNLAIKSQEQQTGNAIVEDAVQKCIAPDFVRADDVENCPKKESLLIWGFMFTGLGLITIYRNKPSPPEDGGRFRGIRNFLFKRPAKNKKKQE